MADLETSVRKIIAVLRMRYRVIEIPQADDEAVAAIVTAAAAGPAPVPTIEAGREPLTLTDGERRELDERYGREADLESLATEILAAFKRSPNGWNARAKLADMDEWRERLGA